MTQYQFLMFDTETTGLYMPSMPSSHPDQPRILSVGAILADELGNERERFYALIKPDGWVVDEESQKIHGITTERAMDEGHPADEVLHQLYSMMGRARVRTGFNEPYDRRMVRIDTYRHGRGVLPEYGHGCELISDGEGMKQEQADFWNYDIPDFDVMKASKEAMGLKKNPKLKDAYLYFFEREMPNAHSAIDDAFHTLQILAYLIDRGDVRLDDEWFAGKAAYKAQKAAQKAKDRESYGPVAG